MPSPKVEISAAASIAGTAMLFRSLARDFIPLELQQCLLTKLHHFLSIFTNQIITLTIPEFEGLNKNQLFNAAKIYMATITSPYTTRFRATLPDNRHKNIKFSVEQNKEITDSFDGFQLKWKLVSKQSQKDKYYNSNYDPRGFDSTSRSEDRYLELSFHKMHKDKVFDVYLPYVLERSEAMKEEKKTLKLFTLLDGMGGGGTWKPWQSVNLDHPSTFDTMAMDTDIKIALIDDLERFLKRKELYRGVGKAWKRGYLLFGPPGTGKSSLIAAMANYLHFDVYELKLTNVRGDSELRRLLISTANQSILVVEDIDCSIELRDKKGAAPRQIDPYYEHCKHEGVTLSGLLNFIDGLWSSCGDERIIVFTTNHKDRLDSALLRPGRMDVQIHLSYCTPCGFKTLASNYLGITEHPLLLEVEELIGMMKVTPAEVGEQLLKNDEPEIALRGLIEFLTGKLACE